MKVCVLGARGDKVGIHGRGVKVGGRGRGGKGGRPRPGVCVKSLLPEPLSQEPQRGAQLLSGMKGSRLKTDKLFIPHKRAAAASRFPHRLPPHQHPKAR